MASMCFLDFLNLFSKGPSLLVYNDSVFSDNDFTNITQLGKSEKFDDNTRIGIVDIVLFLPSQENMVLDSTSPITLVISSVSFQETSL